MRRFEHNKGFTLIELLVVVIIIGILATLSIPRFQRSMEAARQTEARDLLGNMFQAERMYYAENNGAGYTTNVSLLFADIPPTDSSEHYFDYSISAAGTTTFLVRATRNTAGGKSPNWTSAYTIELAQTGSYSTSAW